MPENLEAYFPAHHRVGAMHYPVEPHQVQAYIDDGQVGNQIVYGDLHKRPTFDDQGNVSYAKTNLEYHMLTSDYTGFGIEKGHSLVIENEATIYEVRTQQDVSGISHLRIGEGRTL